jgi:hypothetical protein
MYLEPTAISTIAVVSDEVPRGQGLRMRRQFGHSISGWMIRIGNEDLLDQGQNPGSRRRPVLEPGATSFWTHARLTEEAASKL